MIELIIFLVIYGVSVWYNIRWTNRAHGNDGKYYMLQPDSSDVVITLMPFLNIYALIRRLSESPFKDKPSTFDKIARKIFKK